MSASATARAWPATAGGHLRADGTRLSPADLATAVPLHPLEIEELALLVHLVESWLRVASDEARDDLAACLPGLARRSVEEVIDLLGAASVKLHRLAGTISPHQP